MSAAMCASHVRGMSPAAPPPHHDARLHCRAWSCVCHRNGQAEQVFNFPFKAPRFQYHADPHCASNTTSVWYLIWGCGTWDGGAGLE
eukprot:722604-Rhodomonas_salina.1